MKSFIFPLVLALLLAGCVSPASVPEQTHPLATALPEPTADPPTPSPGLEAMVSTPSQTAQPTDPPPEDPRASAAALAADYLKILTGHDFSALPYEAEFWDTSGEGEWNVSFDMPGQPVTANVRFGPDGELTFFALWTHGKTDATLTLPLAPMPEALEGADYREVMDYWYGLLPIRQDADYKRTELARKNNRLQYPDAYVLSTTKMRFADGSVLTSEFDQESKRLVYFCHYTAQVLGR